MRAILRYLSTYARETDKRIFWTAALLMAVGIFFNYGWGLNRWIRSQEDGPQYGYWYALFLFFFALPYGLQAIFRSKNLPSQPGFWVLLLVAPFLFAWKMVYLPYFAFTPYRYTNELWNSIAYWPFKLAVMVAALLVLWWFLGRPKHRFGLQAKDFHLRPYLLMLALMVPLIAAASTQPDFLATYPKLKNISYPEAGLPTPLQQLLFELSYGSDFLGIELYFRGFLVLSFARWVGKDAILPMALFYCTIHFGKPLGECISSFFGGLLLGVVTYHTRTIWGGLIVHLGIAWLMELGGFLGNAWFE